MAPKAMQPCEGTSPKPSRRASNSTQTNERLVVINGSSTGHDLAGETAADEGYDKNLFDDLQERMDPAKSLGK